ncbi:MAG TPA: hypothetical protein VFP10_09765 [Candidatus Eisenbacteria bacterium]|nr:hypothetical protein [Candidatus Eisenbacteria bacterium]
MKLVDPSGLSRNLSIKIFALLLALAVYGHVQTEKEQEAELRVPLRFAGLPETMSRREAAPRRVAIRLRAKGKQLFKLKLQPPEVRVDMQGVRPGTVQRMLSPTDVTLPPGTQAEVIEIIEPRMVEVTVDTLIKLSVPVQSADLREGWQAAFDPGMAEVMLSVPPGLVSSLKWESVTAQVTTGDRGTGRHSIPLTVQLPSEQELRLVWVHPNRVSVRLTAPAPRAG